MPIKDCSVAGDDKALEYSHKIIKLLNTGLVYMHCLGGKGRAGTIGAIVVGLYFQVSAAEALKYTRSAFALRVDKGKKVKKVPQTNVQIAQVRRLL